MGTGGTISGAGRYLKERNPKIQIVGADPEGSVYTSEETHPYLVEGIGKDTWPVTMSRDVVDRWVRVSDRDSFVTARRLAREEGILAGGSAGTTIWAALEVAKDFGPERQDPHDPPRLGPLVPVEVLRRQLDAPVRLPRAEVTRTDDRRGAALQAGRGA